MGLFVVIVAPSVIVAAALTDGDEGEVAEGGSLGAATVTGESGFVLVDGTTGSMLERNLAEDNRLAGFHIQSSSDNVLGSNRSVDSESNFSLFDSHRNTLVENVAEGSFDGFFMSGSNDNTLYGNRATGTGSSVGYSVGNSEGNAFTRNTAEGFRQGFLIGTNSPGNTFQGNDAVANYLGFEDKSGALGSGTAGTFSSYADNECRLNEFDSAPPGLCEAP